MPFIVGVTESGREATIGLACGCYSADRQVGEYVLYLNHSLACGCYSADRQVGEYVLYLNHSLACGCYSADRQVGEYVLIFGLLV